MTERDWLRSESVSQLLTAVVDKKWTRKLRLLVVAWLRSVKYFDTWSQPESRHALDVVERWADGRTTPDERDDADTRAHDVADRLIREWREQESEPSGEQAVLFARACALTLAHSAGASAIEVLQVLESRGFHSFRGEYDWHASSRLGKLQLQLLRDIFGNPFRPVTVDPRWRTADTAPLARGIYEDRAFDRLPLLADALMDAGCDDEHVLAHCRSDGPHVRGCWVVDLLLGIEVVGMTYRTAVST